MGYLFPLHVSFSVERGWRGFEDWALLNSNGRTAISFYRVVNLFADPCHWKGNEIDPPVGPDVDDLTKAIATFAERAPTANRPTTLAGWTGETIEWAVPENADFGKCDDGIYASWSKSNWRADDFGLRFHQAPGQVDRIYALDIAGTRLVIDENWTPGTSKAELAELDAVIKTLQITR